jgi:transposase
MVWGGISTTGKTYLNVIAGNLTGIIYRDEILHPNVRVYAGAIGDVIILMDDNARLQRARVVTDYLENKTIERMYWPSLSPDLNPKEHAWHKLQQTISSHPELPKNREELSAAIVEQWARLPQIFFQRLIRSMQRR